MPRTEDVPGAQDRCVQPTFANQGFAFGSHGDTRLHHRSWLRDAHVDEMLNARANSPTTASRPATRSMLSNSAVLAGPG